MGRSKIPILESADTTLSDTIIIAEKNRVLSILTEIFFRFSGLFPDIQGLILY